MMSHPPSPTTTASPPTSPAYTPTSPVATDNIETQPISNNHSDTETEKNTGKDAVENNGNGTIEAVLSPNTRFTKRFSIKNGDGQSYVDVEDNQAPYTVLLQNSDGSSLSLKTTRETTETVETFEPLSKKAKISLYATPRRDMVTNGATRTQPNMQPSPANQEYRPISVETIVRLNKAAENHSPLPGYSWIFEKNHRWRTHIREALYQCEFAQKFPIGRPWHWDRNNYEHHYLDDPFILDEVRIGSPQNHHLARMFSIQDAHLTKQQADETNDIIWYHKQHWFDSGIYRQRYHKRRVDLTFSQEELNKLGFTEKRPWVYEHTFASLKIPLNNQLVTFFMADPHPFEVYMLLHIQKLNEQQQQVLFTMPEHGKFSVFGLGQKGLRSFATESIIPRLHMEFNLYKKTRLGVYGFNRDYHF
jgi:hypothetical protein